MIHRTSLAFKVLRRSALAAVLFLPLEVRPVFSQSPETNNRSGEVVKVVSIGKGIRFLPLYAAFEKGFFAAERLEPELVSKGRGADLVKNMLASGEADIALAGPEIAPALFNRGNIETVKIIASIANRDSVYLIWRDPRAPVTCDPQAPDALDWKQLAGKKVLGWPRNSTPGLSLDEALRRKGLAPPGGGNNGAKRLEYPPRHLVGMWFSGEGDFLSVFATRAVRLVRAVKRQGVCARLTSVGRAAGSMLYTVFMARSDFIRDRPGAVQRWVNAIQRSLDWIASANAEEAARIASVYVKPGPRYRGNSEVHLADMETAFRMYRQIGYWSRDVTIGRAAYATLQAAMERSKKFTNSVAFENVVASEFAEKAARTSNR